MNKIRPLESADKDRWLALWNRYLVFYKESLPDEVTELTWSRLLDPTFNSQARILYDSVGSVSSKVQYRIKQKYD
jgi:hypothetical protein